MIAFIDFLIFLLPLPVTGNPWHVSEMLDFPLLCLLKQLDQQIPMTLVLLVNLRPKFLQARQEEILEKQLFLMNK